MFELAPMPVCSARQRPDFIAVRQKVLIVLWTFYKFPEQVPLLFNKFQSQFINEQLFYKSSEQVPLLFNKFQIQFINEQLQCWITLYHLVEYLPL